MTVYLLSKVILNIWDSLQSDQERIDMMATVLKGVTDTVTDAWKKAQDGAEE